LVVVTGLAHQHLQIGFEVAHHTLHAVESSGIAIAVVSTAAAAIAELIAVTSNHHKSKAALHQSLHQAAATLKAEVASASVAREVLPHVADSEKNVP
jgi:hypothetical protein